MSSADPASRSATIAPEDRIPLRQKITFALGVNMDIFCTSLTLGTLWLPVFNIGLGMSPLLLSAIQIVFRIWDAVTDPLMGNFSDNARTRWGRRRPFILIGAIVTALVYPLFWHLPADWSENARAVALAVVGLLFFTGYTIWSMPYYGLQLELTPSYDERTRLAAWGSAFAKVGYLIMGWMLAFVLLVGMLAANDPKVFAGKGEFARSVLEFLQPTAAWIAEPNAGETAPVVGMRVVCWIIAIAMVVVGMCPALFVKERYYKAEAMRQPKTPFFTSLRESFHCRPLWQLIGMTFFLLIGSVSVNGLSMYVNFYYVCEGDLVRGATIAGWKSTVVIVTGFLSIPILTKLSERFDKRIITLAMLGFIILGHLANYFLMTPEHPSWQILSGTVEAVGISAIWLFMPAMKADVVDWDEHHTERRREGSLNSFYSWFVKAALTVSVGLSGAVLQWSGFDATLTAQDPVVVKRMFHLFLFLPLGFWVISLVFAWYYPLGRATAGKIRTELEQRRGKV